MTQNDIDASERPIKTMPADRAEVHPKNRECAIVVRDMVAGDVELISQFAKQLVELHHTWDPKRFFTTPDVAEGYHRFFQSQLGNERVLLLAAEVGGQVIGYLYGSVEPRDWPKLLNPHGAVHDLFVAGSHRGCGVARALMNAARSQFQQRGVTQIVLYSASANVEGQALFQSLGYRSTMVEMTVDLTDSLV